MPAISAIPKNRHSVNTTAGVTFMITASIVPMPSAAATISLRRWNRCMSEAVESVEIANAIDPDREQEADGRLGDVVGLDVERADVGELRGPGRIRAGRPRSARPSCCPAAPGSWSSPSPLDAVERMPAISAITKKRQSVNTTAGVTFMITASITPMPSAAHTISRRRSNRSVSAAVDERRDRERDRPDGQQEADGGLGDVVGLDVERADVGELGVSRPSTRPARRASSAARSGRGRRRAAPRARPAGARRRSSRSTGDSSAAASAARQIVPGTA